MTRRCVDRCCARSATYQILRGMAVVMRIDDVPDDVYRVLRAQARAAGQSLSDYLRGELDRVALNSWCSTPADAGHAAGTRAGSDTQTSAAEVDQDATGRAGVQVRELAVPLQLRRRIERETSSGSAHSTD